MWQAARALWNRVGPRGLALLFFASTDLIYGWSLMHYEPSEAGTISGLDWINQTVSLDIWGAIWITVGIVLLISVFIAEDRIAWCCAIGIKVGWGVMWLAGELAANIPRGYAQAGIWLPAAGLVAVLAVWLPGVGRKVAWMPGRGQR